MKLPNGERARDHERLDDLLAGGDRRSIGRSEEAVRIVRGQPKRLRELTRCLWHSDPRVAMRAADALEKISIGAPAILQPYKSELLGLLAEADQAEVRWHLAVMIPRLTLSRAECRRAAGILEGYLESESSIVKTFAMQGLFDLTRHHSELRPMVLESIRLLSKSGTAAMRARGRKLLKEME